MAGQLLKEGRIDQLWLSIIPSLLGKGVRLFQEIPKELQMKLVGTELWNGIVDLVYEKRW
ncbi:dihydrofolate reductase family protein [Candidatus Pseudoscillospira sp. SGI.172]|uniref:dihydrofolate reductase family protein n=1 Tax=Candidatus Pseudoscillospira sp. SGI.172 TaxID=3420582 RepID=UPI003D00B54B